MKNLFTIALLMLSICLSAQVETRTEPIIQSGINISNDFNQGIYNQIGLRTSFMQDETFGFYGKGLVGMESTYTSKTGIARYYQFQVGAGFTDGQLLSFGVTTGFNSLRNIERKQLNDTDGFGYLGLDLTIILIDVQVKGRTFIIESNTNLLYTSQQNFLGRLGLTATTRF